MGTLDNWSLGEIDIGLSADFEGSLSGLGMDLFMNGETSSLGLFSNPFMEISKTGKDIQKAGQDVSLYNPSVVKGFVYMLKVPTSPSCRLNEDTLTYLNQGQTYELKLKYKLQFPDPKVALKSVIRVCFHEPRMQFMEREHFEYWSRFRPCERMLDVDAPLAYGVVDVQADKNRINAVDVIWRPAVECGIHLRVNCMSTEFTTKKRGGEKGVPFRLQVDTFVLDSVPRGDSPLAGCGILGGVTVGPHIYSAFAQIKVFKPKGADRKLKMDAIKIGKLSPTEKASYCSPSSVTFLRETVYLPSAHTPVSSQRPSQPVGLLPRPATTHYQSNVDSTEENATFYSSTPFIWKQDSVESSAVSPALSCSTSAKESSGQRETSPPYSPCSLSSSGSENYPSLAADKKLEITSDSSIAEVSDWLTRNRFGYIIRVFLNFSGNDLFRLTRRDFCEICGCADGIRLYNALHRRPLQPRLLLYVVLDGNSTQGFANFNAIYLYHPSYRELADKIGELYGARSTQIARIFLVLSNRFCVLVTDEVVINIEEDSRFLLRAVRSPSGNSADVFLHQIQDWSFKNPTTSSSVNTTPRGTVNPLLLHMYPLTSSAACLPSS